MKKCRRFIAVCFLLACLPLSALGAALLQTPDTPAGEVLPLLRADTYCENANAASLADQQSWTFWCRQAGENDAAAQQMGVDFSLWLQGSHRVDGLWMRSGVCINEDSYRYYARPSLVRLTVYHAGGVGLYRYLMEDAYDLYSRNNSWENGYQRLALPAPLEGVSRIDVLVEDWYAGQGLSNYIGISDVMVTGRASAFQPGITQPPYSTSPSSGYTLNRPLATRSGPGTGYDEYGTFLQKGDAVTLLSRAYDSRSEIWWVQAEFSDRGTLRRAYTGQQRIDGDTTRLPVEQAQGEARTLYSVKAFCGPGSGYASLSGSIPAGTKGTVWAREDGYAQFDFVGENGKRRRVWVEENALTMMQ
ncbi:MAG: hypothetical protein E7324_01180 [Clostridiales bacterium]|nr:hypothetical protein [Clostridiales bacterium]